MMRALGVHVFAGGFSLGVERHFELLGHLERGDLGVASWRAYRPGVPILVDKSARWDLSPFSGAVDFVYGNPPCASWSPASTSQKRLGDSLSADWGADVVRVGAEVGAKVVAIESVRGAAYRGAASYRGMAEAHGYCLSWMFVNALDHGLAQRRPRLFVVFTREGVFAPEFEAGPRVSVLEQIAGAPPSEPGDPENIRYVKQHGVTAEDLMRCLPILKPGQQMRAVDVEAAERISPSVARFLRAGVSMPFGLYALARCPIDGPALAVYGPTQRLVHPTEDRLLAEGEQKRLMGYPDDFQFLDKSQPARCSTMGKSVCPPVAGWLAGEVAAYLRGDRDVLYRNEAVFDCCTDPPRDVAPAESVVFHGMAGDIELTAGRESVRAQVPAAAASEPTGGGQTSPRRRIRGSLPGVAINPEWSALPGPTALARLLIAKGADDDSVLAATRATFGGRTVGPHLFTRKDLERLRERILKREASCQTGS